MNNNLQSSTAHFTSFMAKSHNYLMSIQKYSVNIPIKMIVNKNYNVTNSRFWQYKPNFWAQFWFSNQNIRLKKLIFNNLGSNIIYLSDCYTPYLFRSTLIQIHRNYIKINQKTIFLRSLWKGISGDFPFHR